MWSLFITGLDELKVDLEFDFIFQNLMAAIVIGQQTKHLKMGDTSLETCESR